MRLRRCSAKRYFTVWAVVIILYFFYVDIYTYHENSYNWHQIKCTDEKTCTRILLVADPQIIGKYKEVLHFLTPLAIYDSDIYLKKTYHHAFDFVKPNVVVFLGDLMDEGSAADDAEFYGYVRRVFNIFLDKSTSSVQHIWLPGDNDVGGEDFELVTKRKLDRFNRAFSQPEMITRKNITFFKINRLIQSIPIYKEKREFYDSSKIFIGLSHLPLMFMPSLFVEKVVFKKMLPHVLFTAHEHKSMIISTDALLRQDRQIIPVTPENTKVFDYTLGVTDMYEFIIPTCSYRMGTKRVGYGFAVLEKNELRYTVLWSPSRFDQLTNYAVLLLVFLASGLCFVFCYCCCRSATTKKFRY